MRNLSSVVESFLKHLSVRPRVCPGGRRLSVLLPFLCRFAIPQPIQFAAVVGAAVRFGEVNGLLSWLSRIGPRVGLSLMRGCPLCVA